MKTLFIEARAKIDVKLSNELIDQLPNKIILATTVQYLDCLDKVKKQLEENNKSVELLKTQCSKYPGQALGCGILYDNSEHNKDENIGFLFIGDGMFHPKAFMIKTNLPVFVLDPFTNEFKQLDEKDVEQMRRKHKAALVKFLDSKNIGVLISTKPGQRIINQDNLIKQIEEKYKDKTFYKFVCNTINFEDLENFNFVDSWVNTACPRIAYDEIEKLLKPVINLIDIIQI